MIHAGVKAGWQVAIGRAQSSTQCQDTVMLHPVLHRIQTEGFMPLGWFEAKPSDGLPSSIRTVVLIGNVGPNMFARFASERDSMSDSLDEWTRTTVEGFAAELGAEPVFPFDNPVLPFLTWARRAGTSHVSPLGLNIHPTYGLWHAYRAGLLFSDHLDLPAIEPTSNPCYSCFEKPCLKACPVSAFSGTFYDVNACGRYILSDAGRPCITKGCKARLACPVGKKYEYTSQQKQFHMRAFQKARATDMT